MGLLPTMDSPLPLSRRGEEPYGTPQITSRSIAYICVTVVWTVIVLSACAALLHFRDYDCIRKRNPRLIVLGTLMLHIYLTTMLLINPLNGSYPCIVNFWVMNIYLPLGIALFQAQNVQLLSVSAMQKELKFNPLKRPRRFDSRDLTFYAIRKRFWEMTLLSRIYYGIALCLVVQFTVATIVFLISRKFVPFGIAGSKQSNKVCTTGWEWAPSIIYQAGWTFLFGPWLLWKIRNIHDVHRWKLQSTLAIIFSLPGMPMWFISSNVHALKQYTPIWPLGMWFAPGLMVMELVALGFPLYDVYLARKRQKQAISPADLFNPSPSSDLESQPKGSMHNMKAFEDALRESSAELLEYAATREFTGENIVFLTRVRDFKDTWNRILVRSPEGAITPERRRKLFALAQDIFDRSVSLQTSQFPVNIESHIYANLNVMFGHAHDVATASIITPFADAWSVSAIAELTKISQNPDADRPHDLGNDKLSPSQTGSTYGFEDEKNNSTVRFSTISPSSDALVHSGSTAPIPDDFDRDVFDKAERSVKYMVFTNTWARYVDSWRRSGGSATSSSTNFSSIHEHRPGAETRGGKLGGKLGQSRTPQQRISRASEMDVLGRDPNRDSWM